MIASALAVLNTLPATIDQPDGQPFGMKKAMLAMAAVAAAVLVVAVLVGNARAKRRAPQQPTYPILEPPGGRADSTGTHGTRGTHGTGGTGRPSAGR